ncbi:hypothetical protein [Sphaerochaeta sp. PS]|uniref:hypothetical protein n=1 Tax=Sphaerochaeta sp. PS TaxID=3076336 RepID=UPI0028A3EF91|nr:hypothetical protein [Sphaerochaeta sp. PS]MDT4761432.1 hypothetical protein [Sphaerochaeta sp. PS]
MIISYFLILGLFGQEGFFHARSLKLELERLRYQQEILHLQVASLEQQKTQMSSSDALKDAAFRFGYQGEGEQVFYFADDGGLQPAQTSQQIPDTTTGNTRYTGLAKSSIALMALAFSVVFTVVWAFIQKRRTSHR